MRNFVIAASLSRYAALALVTGGSLVLLGWSLNHQPLKALLPTGVSMNPVTALSFILLGTALWLMKGPGSPLMTQRLPAAISGSVAAIGCVRLGSYLGIWSFDIDQILFRGSVLAESNVMAPNTALGFMQLGLPMMMLARGARVPSGFYVIPALTVMLLALFALIGYSYQNALLFQMESYIPMAINTALLFLVLTVGMLCARPNDTLMAVVLSHTTGGMMFRYLLPLAIFIPWIGGWVTIKADLQGPVNQAIGLSLLVVGVIFSLIIVISWTAFLLHRTDSKRQVAEATLRRAHDSLARSVEESKKAEAATAQLAAIVESSEDAIISKDLTGIIRTWNHGAERLFLYTAEEIIGRPITVLIPTDRQYQDAMILERVEKGRVTRLLETVYVRKDGTSVEVSLTVSPVKDATGCIAGMSIIIQDITERKRAEAALQRAHAELEHRVEERTAELSQKTRDLETLLYVTSHDLREPLRSIENFSRMVHDRYADRLDEKGKDFLKRVVRSAQRMDRLMADILALSRVQRMDLPTEEIVGHRIVDEALRRLDDKIRQTGASVRVAPDLPRFRANATWATQGVYNLIANALKFVRTNESPKIEIMAYVSNGQHDEVGFVVRDRGLGVSPEHAERIFQLFQRAVGREVDGTGAGLAIVRQVAERHGGRAWVQPREGGGSEFYLTFSACRNGKDFSS